MSTLALIAAASYLLGSIPFGYLSVRVFRGEDVRKSGSGNIGATNVGRKSPALGVLTLILDALKGAAAVLLAIEFGGTAVPLPSAHSATSVVAIRAALAALFSVVGHVFPVWLKFRGGKGVATGLGSFAVIAPKSVVGAVFIFLAVVLAFRYVSLGSIVAAVMLPVLAWLLHDYAGTPLVLALMGATSLLIVAKHHENIRRLLTGRENRIASRSK
jgi:acyl phosphate:glycerol-3-phosphate acyltransferase